MGKERQEEGTVPVREGRGARLMLLGRRLLGHPRLVPLARRLLGRPWLALAAGAAFALLVGAAGGLWLASGSADRPRAAAAALRGAQAVAAAANGAAPPGPQLPLGTGPNVPQFLDADAKRKAREVVAAARAARSAAAASASAALPPAAAAAPAAPVWAVSTRVLRTRFESEQMLAALRAAAARSAPDDAALRFEVLPVGSDWRAVSWPFVERRAAERLRDELHARGVRVEVLAF